MNYKYCKLCRSDRITTVYTSRRTGIPVMRCRHCGLFFVGKVFSVAAQQATYENQEAYEAFVRAQRSLDIVKSRQMDWLSQIGQDLAIVAFKNTWKRKPKLLDVGCGAGDFLALARDCGYDVSGVEISAAAARMAAESHGIQVRVGPVEEWPTNSFYDVVTMIGVLEHALDPKTMLMHARRLLGQAGLLFVYTPVWGLYDVLTSLIARGTKGIISRPIDRRINATHVQIFPKDTLVRLLEELGFEVLRCKVVCEYNLPVEHYLKSIGIEHPGGQRVLSRIVDHLISRGLFFYNNMRITARKT